MELSVSLALPSRAYDLQMLDRPADRQQDHGWVYGLSPGITSAQWPLDPVTGYPLMHGLPLPPSPFRHDDSRIGPHTPRFGPIASNPAFCSSLRLK